MTTPIVFADLEDAVLDHPEMVRARSSASTQIVLEATVRVAQLCAKDAGATHLRAPLYTQLLDDSAVLRELARAISPQPVVRVALHQLDLLQQTATEPISHSSGDLLTDLRARERALMLTLPEGIGYYGPASPEVRGTVERLKDLARLRSGVEAERCRVNAERQYAQALEGIIDAVAANAPISPAAARRAPLHAEKGADVLARLEALRHGVRAGTMFGAAPLGVGSVHDEAAIRRLENDITACIDAVRADPSATDRRSIECQEVKLCQVIGGRLERLQSHPESVRDRVDVDALMALVRTNVNDTVYSRLIYCDESKLRAMLASPTLTAAPRVTAASGPVGERSAQVQAVA
jgi:hypothetical protein